MDVRVCGPNLNDQSRGTFHVHAANCRRLREYGPGTRFGGDLNGNREMLVKDATIPKVVEAVYDNGIIDEHLANGESRAQVIDSLMRDFYFAPCVEQLPYPEVRDEKDRVIVYEFWVDSDKESWGKYNTDNSLGLVSHVVQTLQQLKPHSHIHIVAHYEDEYV